MPTRMDNLDSKLEKINEDFSVIKVQIRSLSDTQQMLMQRDVPAISGSQRDHELRLQKLESAVAIMQSTPQELSKINQKLDSISSIDRRLTVIESRDDSHIIKKMDNLEVVLVRQDESIKTIHNQQIYWSGGLALFVFIVIMTNKVAIDWIKSITSLKYKDAASDSTNIKRPRSKRVVPNDEE
jgi:hypothetical protein